jgi:hypothetical protein
METAIMAFFVLLRLAWLPARERGEITINGKTQPASQFALVPPIEVPTTGAANSVRNFKSNAALES